MATKSGRSSLTIALVFVVAGGLLAYAFFRSQDDGPKTTNKPEFTQRDAGVAKVVHMSEEERKKYVQDHISIDAIDIVPNMKPDGDAPVPGLLEVKGTVMNNGDKEIDRVFLHVFPMDDAGEVIGSHIENVARKGGFLKPGERRDFAFTIPERKEYAGKFNHMLK